MHMVKSLVCLVFIAGFIVGCGPVDPAKQPAAAPETSTPEAVSIVIACEEVANISPVCGFQNPEDLVAVPDSEFLVVSEMGAFLTDAPGTMSLLDIKNNQRAPLAIDWDTKGPRWGDAACVAPDTEKFSPHGIDLMTRTDGRHQLLVVNHGNEQVEFFELLAAGGDSRIVWKGCAKPGNDAFMNDVASLNDGGFFVTHMWNKSTPFETVVAQFGAGEKIGWVWEWQAASGFTKLPGSDELMPNGITISQDNTKLFVNIYLANKTIKVDRLSGKVEGEISVRSPDNIVIDAAGDLWIASHLNDPINERCEDGHAGPCLLEFQVIKADSEHMTSEVAFHHKGDPMGYATVALPHNGRLYLGSASGDRIASIAL
ncbi:MAG: hypothetical protein ACI8PP_003112 [Candidatus Pseudothioglobus sp.]|jgi:hypothetical protein